MAESEDPEEQLPELDPEKRNRARLYQLIAPACVFLVGLLRLVTPPPSGVKTLFGVAMMVMSAVFVAYTLSSRDSGS